MKGSATRITDFLEGSDKRFLIPVYQRKYDWRNEHCLQLYNDLKKMVEDDRPSHFFGSIVSSVVANGAKIEYNIIDGQQRLTTVSLLLLAMARLVEQGKIQSRSNKLSQEIMHRFLVSPWVDDGECIKLYPVQDDREALVKLYGCEEDFDPSSNLTNNYKYLTSLVLREEVSVDDLYSAIGKLEIICITLDVEDNAQLIFESLNSTGLALEEGDKIRNYMLMGLKYNLQQRYFRDYWSKIDQLTAKDVSSFVRDYLSIKLMSTPKIDKVYREFKRFAEDSGLERETLLKDMLEYARLFEVTKTCKTGLDYRLDDCLERLKRIDVVVIRPFLMEVMRLQKNGRLTVDELVEIFTLVENYLFRRSICDIPTNALNKLFATLNKDVLRYDNKTGNYVDKLSYLLMSKRESVRFPDDEEFASALSNKQVYLMRSKYKAYLFERFENFGTKETKSVFDHSVYDHLEKNEYSIEHIMPQRLTAAWIEALGPNAKEIHATWVHRLANLTLSGYNAKLSNRSFQEKRDAKEGGYKNSGLRMNVRISQKESWGLKELEERNAEMVEQAKEIWPYPKTHFIPMIKEYDFCTLDDENYELTGRDIVKYTYKNVDQPVASWADMFERIVLLLHNKDKTILTSLAYGLSGNSDLENYIKTEPAHLRKPMRCDENIYIEKNTSTYMKVVILRRLFALYGEDPMDLVFYLRDLEGDKLAEASRQGHRKKYWKFALPIIQKQHMYRGTFEGKTVGTSNLIQGSLGVGGLTICCVANYDSSRVDLLMNRSDANKNKEVFDMLLSHKGEIEEAMGVALVWDRSQESKFSNISYVMDGIGIADETEWKRIAKFHAEWSDKMLKAVLPYLVDNYSAVERSLDISQVLKEWAMNKKSIHVDIGKCNQLYTRFTTDSMSELICDTPLLPSGWGTSHRYYYNIAVKSNEKVNFQLELSSKNAPEEFMRLCDKIDQFYTVPKKGKSWAIRIPYKTKSFVIGDEIDKEDIFASLDKEFKRLMEFEADLKKKCQ